MPQNKYAQLSPDHQEEHLSNFVVQKFSHSSLAKYCRNPFDFFKQYICLDIEGQPFNTGYEYSTEGQLVGSGYHKALDAYFSNRDYDWNEIEMCDVSDEYLDSVEESTFKITKKWEDKSTEEFRETVKRDAKICISFFWQNKKWFDDNVQLVIASEMNCYNFIRFESIDYDIPLPCNSYIDLVFIDKDDHLCLMDHKTGKLTTLEEAESDNRQQGILYNSNINASFINKDDAVLWDEVFERFPKAKNGVKTFYVAQCKKAKNKDGSPQVRIHAVDMAKNLPFFEAITFFQMQSFFSAISNPEHFYHINESDYYADKESILNCWMEQYIGSAAYAAAENKQIQDNVVNISKALAEGFKKDSQFIKTIDMATATPSQKINHKLSILGCPATVEHVIDSYSCVTYLLEPKATTTIKKVQNSVDDIAHVLGVSSVRIPTKLTELEDKSYISAEVNKKRTGDEEPLFTPDSPSDSLKIPLGQSIYDELIEWDMTNPSTPHMLVAGGTGSGKSVSLLSMIDLFIEKGINITILDPKYEFTNLQDVTVINEQKKIEEFIEFKVEEIDEIFKKEGALGNSANKHVIIFDETADALLKQKTQRRIKVSDTSSGIAISEGRTKERIDRSFKTLEQNIVSIAQKARSAGIHLILAGQRFSVDVLKGAALANFSTRLCFTVPKKVDSLVMLDQEGAEELNGKGDALYVAPGLKEPIRIQGFMKKKLVL